MVVMSTYITCVMSIVSRVVTRTGQNSPQFCKTLFSAVMLSVNSKTYDDMNVEYDLVYIIVEEYTENDPLYISILGDSAQRLVEQAEVYIMV